MKRSIILLTLLSTICAVDAKRKDNDCNDCEKRKNGVHAYRFECKDERKAAYKRRDGAACLRTMLQDNYCITCEENGDEKCIPHFAAKFSKCLPHKKDGILTKEGQKSYKKLLKALSNGHQDTYNNMRLAKDTVRKLVSPQGSATFSFLGMDSSLTKMPTFPSVSSKKGAAQLLEVYLLAIARDVKFEDYGTGQGTDRDHDGGSITEKASRVLNDFGKCYQGPRNKDGKVDPSVLFRGDNSGSVVGPYLSQFLYQPAGIPVGGFPPAVGLKNLPLEVFQDKPLFPIAGTRNFGISLCDFVAIQNGEIPQPYEFSDYDATAKRYIITGRDLASLVHFDYPYQAYYNAIRTIAFFSFPFAPNSPYQNGSIKNEEEFVDFGPVDAFDLIAKATSEGAKAAWAHKWRAQRVLRPEAFAGLVHITKKEHMKVNQQKLERICRHSQGDIRRLTYLLQESKYNPNKDVDEVFVKKEMYSGLYNVVERLLDDYNNMTLDEICSNFNCDRNLISLMIQENYISRQIDFNKCETLHSIADCISLGDLIASTTYNGNTWNNCNIACFSSTCLPCYYLTSHSNPSKEPPNPLKFTSTLGTMATTSSSKKAIATLGNKSKFFRNIDTPVFGRKIILSYLQSGDPHRMKQGIDILLSYNLAPEIVQDPETRKIKWVWDGFDALVRAYNINNDTKKNNKLKTQIKKIMKECN